MTTTEAEHTVTFEEATALLKRSQARLEVAAAKGMEAASLIGLEREANLLMRAFRQAITGTPPSGRGPTTQRAVEFPVPSRQTPTEHIR